MTAEALHIVDGGGFLHRAYHATAGRGPTAGLQAFQGMLDKLERTHQPRRAVVAMDSRGRTWRHELFAEYKAGRPPAPPELIAQMPRFGPLAQALGWPVVAAAGLEADDLVAAAVEVGRAAGMPVMIHAADKDLLQLVGPDVRQVDDVRGLTWDAATVESRLGVPPDRLADYLALRGDPGDNVPGLPGVGEKTAAELVRQYSDLEALIAANPKVRGKYPAAGAGAELLRLSRRLVELDAIAAAPHVGAIDRLVIGRRDQAAIRELTAPPRPPEQLGLAGVAPPAAPAGRALPVSDPGPGPTAAAPYWAGLMDVDARELLEERAAIREYCGGQDRAAAERAAFDEVGRR